MRINFGGVKDAKDRTELIPEGDYLAQLIKIEETTTTHNDPMWKLRWAVADGEHRGRYIFDNLVFSEASLPRAKLILKRLGFDVSGELEFEPKDLKGKYALVTVKHKPGNDNKVRAEVPFGGYQAVQVQIEGEDDDTEDKPPF